MRKLGFTALALGAALTLSLGLSVPQASADETPAASEAPSADTVTAIGKGDTNDKVSVGSVYGDTLTIETAKGVQEVLVGTATAKGSKGAKVLNVSTWDTYVVTDKDTASGTGYVYVDLSKLAITKDNYIRIKADAQTDDEALNVVIPASKTNLKIKYSKTDASLEFKAGSDNYTGTLAYRTANGTYDGTVTVKDGKIDTTNEDDNTLDIATYQMTGATLYFFEESTPYGYTSEDSNPIYTALTGELKVKDETIHLSDAKTAVGAVKTVVRKSKEAKVTIAKLANAPKVSANYVKGTITVPKDAQYRIVMDGADKLDAFSATQTAKKDLTVAADTDELTATKAFAIDVKTVKSGKLDSKIGHYTFDALTDTDASDVTAGENPVVTTPKPKSTAATTQAITYTNKSEKYTYKVSFYKAGATVGKDTASGSVTLKPLVSGKTQNVATLKKVPLDAIITITRVGDTKNKVWAGTEVTFDGSAAGSSATVTVDNAADGSLDGYTLAYTINGESVDDLSAVKENDTVTVSVTSAKQQLKFTGVTAEESNNGASGGNLRYTYTFTMGTQDVTIEAQE